MNLQRTLLVALFLAGAVRVRGQATTAPAPVGPAALRIVPNLVGQTDRPLRYRPEGADFVIENGQEYFNRPLYGRNTAARVDAGDKPEFTIYLPGRGGNLRLGIRASIGAKWLANAERIVTRYRPGEMLYEIHDPLLGPAGVLNVAVVALHETDGLAVRVEAKDVADNVELTWAYGGVNGQRGSRDGDIGTERVPISEYFQLKPAFCENNQITISGRTFTLRSKPAVIVGLMPAGAALAIADANKWGSYEGLLASVGKTPPNRPVVIGHMVMPKDGPICLALQRISPQAAAAEELQTYRDVTEQPPGATNAPPAKVDFIAPYGVDDVPRVFADAEKTYAALRDRVSVETPDAYINAAVGALNLAADAVWDDPQQNIMHGAIAWRSRLLGWRGPSMLDALGWHDRATKYLTYWAGQQNTDPIPDKLPGADENSNLSRSEKALHSNGDMSRTHYDMNKVYIDTLFRHLLWTGDLDLARKLWPTIERHLAWERRLFRREFGPEKLPLYEAYADIWASDDIQYNGGGVSYASAYNCYHNRMAAKLAKLIGKDPSPYEREAQLIGKAMREFLWLNDEGAFAEYKDLLGLQLVHPSAGLWSFYHTMDSEVPTPAEARRMTAALDRAMPHIPVRGPGVPDDRDYYVMPSSQWMPYSWSVNNVCMNENLHTALGLWQAGESEEAFRLAKGALLGSMYMGICPGNVGTMNYLDVYRRESQRDFADGCGVTSRAIIQGLFGVKPDALAGELRIEPGFPRDWASAKLVHPDIQVEFKRDGMTDNWSVGSTLPVFRAIKLRLPMAHQRITRAQINGAAAKWTNDASAGATPSALFDLPGGQISTVKIQWDGDAVAIEKKPSSPPTAPPTTAPRAAVPRAAEPSPDAFDWRAPRPAQKCEPIDLTKLFNDRVTNIFAKGKYRSPRSPFVSLALPSQGIGAWAGHVNESATIDDTGLRHLAAANSSRLLMPNGVPFTTPVAEGSANILFTSQYDNYPREAVVPLAGNASHAYLLMAGSTYFMQSQLDNGEVVVTYTDGSTARLALHNPTTWWPIEQDYFLDDYQFRLPAELPPRVNLKTGEIRLLDEPTFKGRGGPVPGGAATVLQLSLDPAKPLRSLTVRALANEVVIGLMAATLERP